MAKQTARKWTFKGTSASLAVMMAFGLTPAFATAALAEEGQPSAIVAAASTADEAETTAAGVLSAAASYAYDDGFAYGMAASVVDAAGESVTSYYEAEGIASVGDDLARYLGALHRAEGAAVDSIVYDGQTYVWNDAAGLKGSNWVKSGTTDEEIEQAKEDESLSDYTLVGAITAKVAGAGANGAGQEAASGIEAKDLAAGVSLSLEKDGASFAVTLGAAMGGVSDAVSGAEAASTVVLNEDWALDEAVSLDKDLSIDGNGHAISGKADDVDVRFEITGGTFALSNARLVDFGGAAETQQGNGAVKVPVNAAEDTKVVLDDVDFGNFNRSAVDIQAGSFEITGGSIDCNNSNEAALTKGVKIGGSDSRVTGVISGVSITNSASSYAEWETAAIEVYSNADVAISNVVASNVQNGIHVDNYYFDDKGDVTVDVSGDCKIDAGDGSAIRVYGKADAKSSARVNVSGGVYKGAVKEIDADGSISITGGAFSQDPSAFLASGYGATESDGVWTVAKSESGGDAGSGGGGGDAGGSVTPGEDTVVNEDGSTTTTVTEEDGSTVATTESADGSASTVVKKDADGVVTSIEATVAGDTAPAATVALPMEPVVAQDASSAVAISVKAPEGTKVSVPVADAEGAQSASLGCVLVMVDAEGNEVAMPKTGVSESGLLLEVPGDCTLKVVDGAVDFPDVDGSEWYATSGVADFASARNILSGVVLADGTAEFQGDQETSRGMFVTMLNRLELEPAATGSAPEFPDVADGVWYEGTAAWAAEQGLLSGYDDGTFGGDDDVTREQIAAFLMRYAEWLGVDTSARAESTAPDADVVSDWASESVSWAVAEGYLLGDSEDGALRPTEGATRAEAAAIIMRFVNSLY